MTTSTSQLNKLMSEAQSFERTSRLAEAEAIYRRIIASDPSFHPAFHAMGILAYGAGNLPLAADLLKAAIALDKKVGLYQRNYGEMCRRLGRLDEAIRAGKASCKLAPGDVDAHYNLGLAYTDAKDYSHAIKSYRKALKLNPNHGLSWNNLGSAIEQQGDKDAAQEAYAKAVKLNPQHAEAQNNLGAIFSERGKLDEARASFQVAIECKPDFVEAHYNLSAFKTYSKEDPHLAHLKAVFNGQNNLTIPARIRYNFALGKALDDTGDYDAAFAAYAEGNRLQHAILPMDETRADAMLERIIKVFDESFFENRKHWQGSDKSPVFIVGMPRSGTTLLEQILCSHPSVYGAGELIELSEVISAKTSASADKPFTAGVHILSEADIRKIGDEYVKRVWKLSPESQYITDKMPANFFYLGLIHLALPNAKIIHAMRDPMDSCFSCFSRLFNDTMEFAYDQGTLGRYYVRYMKLMQHWHKVLPKGRILDLPYEQMIADTEGQARKILEFVGLPWDENCLNFHQNKRLVKTASVAQVRKPIYKTSVARWKLFAQHLRPLLEIVKDYRNNDDVADLLASKPIVGNLSASPETVHLEGIALYKQNRFAEALARIDQALSLRPDFPQALNTKGFVLQDIGRMQEALACFEKSVQLAPEFAMARLNLGMAQLKLGDFQNGWDNYEARWTGSAESGSGSFTRPNCPLPNWNGEQDTKNKRLLVITEQGFGDTFQFSRYLNLAAKKFSKVGYVCSQPTLRLMEWSFNDRVVLMDRLPSNYEAWDMQCALMSLPRAFQTRIASIPQISAYLRVPEKTSAHWQEKLALAAPDRFRIGIAWAGRKVHQYDARRSLSFSQILPLLEDERITWVSLQKWAPEDARPSIPESVDWLDWTEELTDFADSAALVQNLDLVISIDSSMVHLAGALNKPVWMLNRFDSEWRWLQNRVDSPWYPKLRIFNQPAFGDWASVLREVKDELSQLEIKQKGTRKIRGETALNPDNLLETNAVVRETYGRPPVGARFIGRNGQPSPDKSVSHNNERPNGQSGLNIEQAIQLANQYQNAGRLQEAELLLSQILQAQPKHAHALHLLGVVAFQAGNPARASELINHAIAIQPAEALFHSNLAEMSRREGKINEAIKHGEQAVLLDPSMASAHSNLGIAYYDAKNFTQAKLCQEKALVLQPNMTQALNNSGSIARANKNLPESIEWYRKAIAGSPDYLETLSNLGAVLVEDDRADEALPILEKALRLAPNYPEAVCNMGLAQLKQEHLDQAISLLQRSLQLKPGYPEALIGLGQAFHDQDSLEQAEEILKQAIAHAPDKLEAYCKLGAVYTEQGKAEQAESAYQTALDRDAEMVDALTGLGNLRLEQGKINEAEELLLRAIAIKPDDLGARFHLTQTKKVKPGDKNLAALEIIAADISRLSNDKKISLHYALGKAYDDVGAYDKAFPHFIEGARIKRAKLDYDANADEARINRIIEVVDARYLDQLRGAGNPSQVPIFVLGMPRSGTTLTEQIIASHPDVYGAGELSDLMDIVQLPANGQTVQPYPENLIRLSKQDLSNFAEQYISRICRRAPAAKRITDKMPANYMAMGLIPLMLPHAKIIHVKRNPVDTCLSCYTRLFNRHQDATYDLAELGRHYVGYERLMQHWRKVMPVGSFIEVQYEDIVADMEGQARRLIDYCELEWNDACLEFHKNKRSVRTASLTQVRQPIYNSSVERWRHYEKFLGPLLSALGDLAPR